MIAEFAAGFDFEGLYEREKVGRGREALREEVKMVGHKAVGMNCE